MKTLLLSFLPYDFAGFAALGLTWVLTGFVREKLIARAILDRPNERSMHASPVPRGGGLAVMAVIAGGMLLFAFFFPNPAFPLLLIAVALLMAVSWIDDKKGLGAGLRLAAHLVAALIGSFALGDGATMLGGFLPFWLDRTLMILGWAWLINLTNFMDGIDGITGVQTAAVALGAGLLFWALSYLMAGQTGPNPDMALAALMGGACLGFLPHNWHPARIFLGDVGSVPLGFLTGFLLLRLAVLGHPAAALILPLYYLADSGITLVRRVLRGEKVWQPHRSHFYQRAAAGEGRHDVVALRILGYDLWLVFLAGASLWLPLPALSGAFLLVALLLVRLHKSAK